jgi:hypothetical protein
MNMHRTLAMAAILLTAACASKPQPQNSGIHWQFSESSDRCEIQSTDSRNPQIVWQAVTNTRDRLEARMLIRNAHAFEEIKDGVIAKFVLNKVEFDVPLFETATLHQYRVDYQSLAVLSNLFITMIPRSKTMTMEIRERKYHYSTTDLNMLLDLWTECFIHNSR